MDLIHFECKNDKDLELLRAYRICVLAKRHFKGCDKKDKDYGCYKYWRKQLNRKILNRK